MHSMNKQTITLMVMGVLLGTMLVAGAQTRDELRPTQASTVAALVAQDAEFNVSFRTALQNTAVDGRPELQASQRRWIQARNELCALTILEAAARDWPTNLDAPKADCVMRMTQNRISTLRMYRPLTSTLGFTDQDQWVPIQGLTFPIGHTSGKRYAEIEIQRELLSRTGENVLNVGIDNVDGFYALSGPGRIAPEETHEVIGMAVDLDSYQFRWRNATIPASAEGQPLARGTKPYTLKVKGGSDLHLLLARGQVRINHGQRPFHYPMPAGYAPWYVPELKDGPITWLMPPYERMGGLDRPKVASGYWMWLLDREPALNPVQDRTGAACTLKQGDKFWYLAGAQESERIERRCAVPYGTTLILPVMAIMLNFGEMGDCQKNKELASLSPYTLQNTWLEIDGTRFDRLQDYSANISTCPPLEVGGKLLSRQANWLGLWVPLRPLPRGDHVISFGGRFNATNVDRKVTYKITVQ